MRTDLRTRMLTAAELEGEAMTEQVPQGDPGGMSDPAGGPQVSTGDSNADGVIDFVTFTEDDGTSKTAIDADQSGTFEEIRIDNDGDWVADVTVLDTTGDGVFDVAQVVDPRTGEITETSLASPGAATDGPTPSAPGTPGWYEERGLPIPAGESGTPPPGSWNGAGAPAADLVFGDGALELEYAQDQAEPGYCGPASIAMILSELHGYPIDDVAVAQDVENFGLLVKNESGGVVGMTSTSVVTMFEAYGVEAEVEYGDVSELQTYLDEAPPRNIILAVDSSEVWGWPEDGRDISDAGTDPTIDRSDHFLVITEINYETGMVTLNDPGLGEAYGFAAGTGHGYQVSIELFQDAWADSGNEMVVTGPIAVRGGAAASPGPVMLPREVCGWLAENHPEAVVVTGDNPGLSAEPIPGQEDVYFVGDPGASPTSTNIFTVGGDGYRLDPSAGIRPEASQPRREAGE